MNTHDLWILLMLGGLWAGGALLLALAIGVILRWVDSNPVE